METNGIYRTSDLYIAAWLLSKGLQLQNIDRSDARRSEFIFADRQHEPDLVHSSMCGQATGNPADYVYCFSIQIIAVCKR